MKNEKWKMKNENEKRKKKKEKRKRKRKKEEKKKKKREKKEEYKVQAITLSTNKLVKLKCPRRSALRTRDLWLVQLHPNWHWLQTSKLNQLTKQIKMKQKV